MKSMKRSLVAALMISGLLTLPVSTTAASATVTPDQPTELSGTGIWSVMGCAGCVLGGVGIALGGPAAISIAMATPGGAYVAVGCAGTCIAALT